MRKQQQIWHQEHTTRGTLPTMANVEPTSGVTLFAQYLEQRGIPFSGNAVDIGAGKGRNSIYLAQLGYTVTALEYVEPAVTVARQLAQANNLADKITFKLAEIDRVWEVSDSYFDVAIDSFASIDIETKAGRQICRDEMFRTLKPGGLGFVNVCSVDDEWEKQLIVEHPGPEPNSTLWPQNGKFQKDYSEEELKDFYKMFEIVELKKLTKPAFKLGRKGIATNLWLVVRKLRIKYS